MRSNAQAQSKGAYHDLMIEAQGHDPKVLGNTLYFHHLTAVVTDTSLHSQT